MICRTPCITVTAFLAAFEGSDELSNKPSNARKRFPRNLCTPSPPSDVILLSMALTQAFTLIVSWCFNSSSHFLLHFLTPSKEKIAVNCTCQTIPFSPLCRLAYFVLEGQFFYEGSTVSSKWYLLTIIFWCASFWKWPLDPIVVKWNCSFLSQRRQAGKLDGLLSEWDQAPRCMPGSQKGPSMVQSSF